MELLFVVLNKQYGGYHKLYLLHGEFLDNGLSLTNHVCIMRMHNSTVSSKVQLISFVYYRFIYKLVEMVIFIVQTKAKLFLTK